MTWDEFESEMRQLAQKIDFTPDVIIGIARGGVIPATLLSKRLNIKSMNVLSLERQSERRISADILSDMNGKKVLLVEDMIETGRGLLAGKKFLEARGAVVSTACLYTMPISEVTPDYFLREIPEVAEFPWNKV